MSSCPVSTLHIRKLQSPLPPKPAFPLQEATSEPSAEKLTPLTCELYFGCKLVTTLTTLCNGRLRLCRFLEVSGNTYVILVYVSPPVTGLNTNAKCCHLWPFRHKIFAPVCVQMRWMRPSSAPAAMTSPAGPYCTLIIAESKRAVSHLLAPW